MSPDLTAGVAPAPAISIHLSRMGEFEVDADPMPVGEVLGRVYPDYRSARAYAVMITERFGGRLVDHIAAAAA